MSVLDADGATYIADQARNELSNAGVCHAIAHSEAVKPIARTGAPVVPGKASSSSSPYVPAEADEDDHDEGNDGENDLDQKTAMVDDDSRQKGDLVSHGACMHRR